MTNDLQQRFIQLLEEDLTQLRNMAAAWEELEKNGGRLESLEGNPIARAGEIAARLRVNEQELLVLIATVRASS
jgi:hypothetical protein